MTPGAGPVASPDEQAALIALASLEHIGPATLLDVHRSDGAVATLDAIRRHRFDSIRALAERVPRGDRRRRLAHQARDLDPNALLDQHTAAGRRILVADRFGYPNALEHDPAPPAILFVEGDPALLDRPAVAIVGTRNTTRIGREIAIRLGHDLARHGVQVTSGLALGIDAAAHEGTLSVLGGGKTTATAAGRPIGVIASGLDVAYPRRHGPLQRRVAADGVLVSELPLGHRPKRWRFPARNRLIAAFSAAVIVVESRLVGGSFSTVDAAIDRGLEVLAVPGHPLAPASAGTNQLIVDGAALVRDVDDVFSALGWQPAEPVGEDGPNPVTAPVHEPLPDGLAGNILGQLLDGPASLAELVLRLDAPMGDIAASLVQLEADRYVVTDNVWFELGARGAAAVGT